MVVDMSRIGEEINKIRKEKGVTQKQLGRLVGVSESFIIEVEIGRRVLNDELILRISKALGQEIGRYDLYLKDEQEAPAVSKSVKAEPRPVQQVWNDALGGVLKSVPVFDYKMDKAVGTRQLPIVSNKVEGFAKEKVFYLKIEDEDMSGFRISKGDLALAFSTQEIEKDAIFFIEYGGRRAVRQLKKLDGDRLLVVSSKGSLFTETVSQKNVRIFARLVKLEITL